MPNHAMPWFELLGFMGMMSDTDSRVRLHFYDFVVMQDTEDRAKELKQLLTWMTTPGCRVELSQAPSRTLTPTNSVLLLRHL